MTNKLENMLKGTKVRLLAAAASFYLAGCGTTHTNGPNIGKRILVESKEVYDCSFFNPTRYCEDDYVSPVANEAVYQ